MSPNENNPGATGAAGGLSGSSVPSPVDFTNPSSLNTNTSSLSMADSLASAQDDLTSAGQAANTGVSMAMGLNELGDVSATMLRPDEALTPADPVPGSIGSVTSVPPLASEPMNANAFGNATVMGGAATPTTSAMPTFGGGASSTDTTMAAAPVPATSAMPEMSTAAGAMGDFGAAGTASAAGGSGVAGASTKPVQPYYNPFARTMGGSNGAQTSSTNVPPTLQPQAEMFSGKMGGEKKKTSVMTLLGWLLTALFAVTTVVFLILWINAMKNPKIIYRDPVAQGPSGENPGEGNVVNPSKVSLKCTMDEEPTEEEMESMPGLVGMNSGVTANYEGTEFTDMLISQGYTFADVDAASAAKGTFDMMAGLMMGMMADYGVSASVSQLDNLISYDTVMTASALTAEGMSVSEDFPVNENGEIDTNIDALRTTFEGRGAVCVVE